ncbi:hypothetical protein BD626DRAFT_499656, partial [Schizophyllum amplum]
CGITHAFVNWGSDHPGYWKSSSGNRSRGTDFRLRPGFWEARAVIVHTDVGTQVRLAGAVHNADKSRTPVLIYAGASPSTVDQDIRGGRNEWNMYTQDIHDQPAIVRQYMRFTAQISSSKHVSQMIMSEPQGPIMEEEITDIPEPSGMLKWPIIEPAALSESAAKRIAQALSSARHPLIITSHLGRNPAAVDSLLALSMLLALPIVATCPAVVNTPFSHPYFCKLTYLQPGTHSPLLRRADVILVLDADIAWVPANEAPSASARVFVLNSADPLNTNVGYWHVDAELVAKADAASALEQIFTEVRALDTVARDVGKPILHTEGVLARGKRKAKVHADWRLTAANALGGLRKALAGKRTLVLNEGVTNYPAVWEHLRPEARRWGRISGRQSQPCRGRDCAFDIVVAIVGDGSFVFGAPSAAYWMARRYDTPYLTVILNNGGWQVSHNDRLSIGMGAECPDYSQIAVAASGNVAWGRRVASDTSLDDLNVMLTEAVSVVVEQGRCAVLDVQIEA